MLVLPSRSRAFQAVRSLVQSTRRLARVARREATAAATLFRRSGWRGLGRMASLAAAASSPDNTATAAPSCPAMPGACLSLSRIEFEAECQRRCQTAYLGNATSLCRVLGKYLMHVSTTDLGIAPHMCLNGFWESWITRAVVRTVQSGWTCVDIGANCDYYSLILADLVGPAGRVVACEPHPLIAEMLARTLEVNGYRRTTTIVREAIADSDGAAATLALEDKNYLNSHLTSGATGIAVKTATLDHICNSLDRVDFIKIDAEGAEERIWKGMRRTRARNPKLIILMEFSADRYRDPAAFVAAITQEGFELRHVDFEGEIKPVTAQRLVDVQVKDWMLWLQPS